MRIDGSSVVYDLSERGQRIDEAGSVAQSQHMGGYTGQSYKMLYPDGVKDYTSE